MGILKWLFGKNTSTSTPVEPPKILFDENNPHEVYHMVNALSTIVGNVSDSWLTVYLQDENPSKGWPKDMGLSITIDEWIDNGYQPNAATFVKLGCSHSDAQYLASIPFEVERGSLKYKFTALFDYPASQSQFIISEMQKGTARSTYVAHGIHQVKIEDRHGLITCKST